MVTRLVDSADRRRRYARTSALLALLDDEALADLAGPSGRGGWGTSTTATLDDGGDRLQVFTKRIPVTALEAAHRHSTRNRHRLPAFYNYGVGSAGFGVYRELATHVKTTRWVLGDEIDTFPLLLHARGLPRRAARGRGGGVDGPDYVRYWNGSKRIGAFIAARADATEELCVVLEHVPHTMQSWLVDHQTDAPALLGQLCDTLGFLHDRRVLHLDAHYGNVVTDGFRVRLTDFGLALDDEFELSPAERRFFESHQHYDFGEAIANLGSLLVGLMDRRDEATKASIAEVASIEPGGKRAAALAIAVERIVDRRLLDVDPVLVDLIVRYRDVIVFMWTFFNALQASRRKDTPFDDDRLAQLIDDAGGLPTA
jgi:hypothetical protein